MSDAIKLFIDVPGQGVYPLSLGSSVQIVECKYRCGGKFVVTTMLQSEPHHLECAINAMRENMAQLQAKNGLYYDKWRARMVGWALTQNS